MSNEVKRLAFIPRDKREPDYTDLDVIVGELVINSENAYAWLKINTGELIPLRGAGYIDLLAYIRETMAIGTTPKDIHSFLLDTAKKIPTQGVPAGLLKVRVPTGTGDDTIFKEIGIVTNGEHCVIYTGENNLEGQPITKTVTDFYLDITTWRKTVDETLAEHTTQIKANTDELKQRSKDTLVYYDKFEENNSADIVYKIKPDTTSTDAVNYLFETTTVLGTDNGDSINRHHFGWFMDYANHLNEKRNAYVLDIGNKVKLAVKFYYKDENLYVRPTQIDGEFILRDKSANAGSFKPYTGEVEKISFSASGLTPKDLIVPINDSNNEEAIFWTYEQRSHGLPPMSACYFDKLNLKWKLATLENRAKAIVIPIDNNWLGIYTGGHVQIPEEARSDLDAMEYTSNDMWYLHQDIAGGAQKEYPTFVYQELGYSYSKLGELWFAINISTPVELLPHTIKNMASKADLFDKQHVSQNIRDLPNLDLPNGSVITVSDREFWHLRKVEQDRLDDESIQIKNGLWANIATINAGINTDDLNGKLDKGVRIDLLAQYPDASAIIEYMLKCIVVPEGSSITNWTEMINNFDLYLKKVNISQDMELTAVDHVPSSAIFNQLLKLVRDMANGNIGAIVPQENTPIHVQYGILQRGMITIQSDNNIWYNPVVYIEGQLYDRQYYTIQHNTGILTLKEPYSTLSDVRYTVIDVFSTDIKYITDSSASLVAEPWHSSLRTGDVVKVLGDSSARDGGHHLRMISNTADNTYGASVALANGLHANIIPYTHIKNELAKKVNKQKFAEYRNRNSVYKIKDAVALPSGSNIQKKINANIGGRISDEFTFRIKVNSSDLTSVNAETVEFHYPVPSSILANMDGKVNWEWSTVNVVKVKSNNSGDPHGLPEIYFDYAGDVKLSTASGIENGICVSLRKYINGAPLTWSYHNINPYDIYIEVKLHLNDVGGFYEEN